MPLFDLPPSPSHDADLTKIVSLLTGYRRDPFAYFGMHEDGAGGIIVRSFCSNASAMSVLDRVSGAIMFDLERVGDSGLYAGRRAGPPFAYRLQAVTAERREVFDDPYSFGPSLSGQELRLHAEGEFRQSFDAMGAQLRVVEGINGVRFAVWAPHARRVSVVGDFNAWDGRRHPMHLHPGAGIWEIFLPAVGARARYKFEIEGPDGGIILKADPFAFAAEHPPLTASIVCAKPPVPAPPTHRLPRMDRDAPISIYEVHLGSWRRVRADDNRSLRYDELADTLVPYVKDMGFTHIELMPLSEYPFDGSWGYQPTALFAPTSRYGSPQEFRDFVARCHAAGLGVILDWVAGHFPNDPHGLAHFDGTALYEHRDRREGIHPDWNTHIYNYGSKEVRGFLLSNALFWLGRYRVDGLRVDAVASMLYRNYSRKDGEWVPNIHGGIENLEAVDFLRKLNEAIYERYPHAATIAEESTAWPKVSQPTYAGGLGFGYKWNMGWMHDTLEFMMKEPVHRKYHMDRLTFGLAYAFDENFILPLSHDEVVHGKRSLLGKMPGDRWQKFANLRAYYAFMFTHPGKKLLFMGAEFAQEREWNHDASLDWSLLDQEHHRGIQNLIRDLNGLYRTIPALHARDCAADGFSWIDCADTDASVISYIRRGADPEDFVVVVCNFTPVVRRAYRVGVPFKRRYAELLNSDSKHYGGSNVGNLGAIEAQPVAAHGFDQSVSLSLPPLGVVVLKPEKTGF